MVAVAVTLPQPAFLEIGRGLTRGDTPAYPFYPLRFRRAIFRNSAWFDLTWPLFVGGADLIEEYDRCRRRFS